MIRCAASFDPSSSPYIILLTKGTMSPHQFPRRLPVASTHLRTCQGNNIPLVDHLQSLRNDDGHTACHQLAYVPLPTSDSSSISDAISRYCTCSNESQSPSPEEKKTSSTKSHLHIFQILSNPSLSTSYVSPLSSSSLPSCNYRAHLTFTALCTYEEPHPLQDQSSPSQASSQPF